MQVTFSYDMRSAPFGVSHAELYAAALDQCVWLDQSPIEAVRVLVSEHHAAEDGYLPSPIVFASAVASRTRRLAITIGAAIAPLYHPLRLAEDLAVLDLISGGRVSVVLVGGYRDAEFVMYGVDPADRAILVEEAVSTLTNAWSGEPFEYHSRRVTVTPRPMQRPRPAIVLGGSSRAMARRAARIADGFLGAPELVAHYQAECLKLGRVPGGNALEAAFTPNVVLVCDDEEKGWTAVGEYCLHMMNSYGRWLAESPGVSAVYREVSDIDTLRATGQFLVLTPVQCVELARRQGTLMFAPLVGGFPPESAQRSLELFASQVLPKLAGS